ncbi:LolA family protein [Flammeovirga aprica]|uniref:Outer membrane lipoprotein carrier protein LolA n=1 Tax=Flammeovirga aprica JL-4 TaxID=694437 RepID=A0A7X9RS21_9BACT|nr:outer membrane lipoprotein carrier protein LolA [Flammeovirga aprica]NME66511.1 outer membrane lipoprotein carrier protein LolA [Flammeovirga aprica JL-4]
MKLKYYIGFTFLLIQSVCWAQQYEPIENTDQAIMDLKENAKTIQSISSDFVQTKHLSLMNQDLISKGAFLYKSPNRLRWEYLSPITYAIIINGDIISMIDEEKTNTFDASSNPIFSVVNKMMLNMVNGNIGDDENFEVKYFKGDNTVKMQLKPKDSNWSQYMAELHLYISLKDYSVFKVVIKEQGEDYTQFDFVDHKYNETISDDNFVEK